MSLLTRDQALSFLNKLGFRDGLASLQSDSRKFISDLIVAYQEHQPFQSVTMVAQTTEERHVPTLEEVVAAGLSLEGGVCFTLNCFFCLLLRALGFKADVLDGNYSSNGNDHSHVILLLSDLRFPGDNYVIDVGNGFPSMAMIPLADLPVTHYFAGLEYRYQYEGEDVIRLHRAGDTTLDGEKPVMKGEWRQVFHFRLTPVDFDYFRPHMERIYMDEVNCDFLRCIRAVRFPPEDALKEGSSGEGESGGAKRVMLAFKDRSLLTGPMDDATKEKVEADVWAARVKKYFPNIPPAKVDAAVNKIRERDAF